MLWTVLTNLAKIKAGGGVDRDTFFSPFTEQQGDTQHGGGAWKNGSSHSVLSLSSFLCLGCSPDVAIAPHRPLGSLRKPTRQSHWPLPPCIVFVSVDRFALPMLPPPGSPLGHVMAEKLQGRFNPWIFLFKMTILGLPLAKRSVPPKPGPDILIFFETHIKEVSVLSQLQ